MNIKKDKTICFDINDRGDMDAGIWGFTDVVSINIESGDPGGAKGEFEAFMRDALLDWYDGATVIHRKE